MIKDFLTSIRYQLVIAFLILTIIPLIVGGTILVWSSYQDNLNNILLRQKEVVKRTKLEVKFYFNEIEHLLNDINRYREFLNLNSKKQEEIISQLLGENKLVFSEMSLLDINGNEKIKLSNSKVIDSSKLKNRAKDEIFLIPKTTNNIYYSHLFYENSESIIKVSIPVLNHLTGKTEAILSASIRFKPIGNIFANLNYQEGESTYLTNSNNLIIAYKNPSIVMKKSYSQIKNIREYQYGLNNRRVFGFFEVFKLGTTDFKVVVESQLSMALSPAFKEIIIIILVIIITIILAVMLFIFAIKRIVEPIEMTARAAIAIKNGDLSKRISIENQDEIGALAKSFNQMTIRLESAFLELENINKNLELRVKEEIDKRKEQEQILIQQSKMAALGEMIGNIAHQWRQPLNSLGLFIQDIDGAYEAGEITQEYIDNLIEKSMNKIEHMSATINDFRDFFKPNKVKKSFSVLEAVNSASDIVLAQLKAHNIFLNINSEDTNIYGLENEFKQVVINIVNNAKDAIFDIQKNYREFRGEISIEIVDTKENAIINIYDNGGGIKQDIIDKVFEPYFTTKFKSQGVGIGLFMSKMIIDKNMQGNLSVKNIKSGAKFIIMIPKSKEV